ncbi:unnamed protein product [Clonostachys solani]|uniref:Uncharacterized protein n=1 Tax=Clonostachys solani TaxID=160281 RepID=A0A9P0ELV2_9HYPO|nr:unnamed protein product [Clonostachys solani]
MLPTPQPSHDSPSNDDRAEAILVNKAALDKALDTKQKPRPPLSDESRIDEQGSYFVGVVPPPGPHDGASACCQRFGLTVAKVPFFGGTHQFLSQGHNLVLGRGDRDAHGPIGCFEPICEDADSQTARVAATFPGMTMLPNQESRLSHDSDPSVEHECTKVRVSSVHLAFSALPASAAALTEIGSLADQV